MMSMSTGSTMNVKFASSMPSVVILSPYLGSAIKDIRTDRYKLPKMKVINIMSWIRVLCSQWCWRNSALCPVKNEIKAKRKYQTDLEFGESLLRKCQTIIKQSIEAAIIIQIHKSKGFTIFKKNDFLSGKGNIAQNPFVSKVLTCLTPGSLTTTSVLRLKSTRFKLKSSWNFAKFVVYEWNLLWHFDAFRLPAWIAHRFPTRSGASRKLLDARWQN